MSGYVHSDIVFEAQDLCVSAYRHDAPPKQILKGINFTVRRGQVVALIGESGSGKTTLSLAALGYCKPGLFFAGGAARLNDKDLTKMSVEELRPLRGVRVSYLAQSAAGAFNPSITINEQVTESPVLHGVMTQDAANQRALGLFKAMELPDPEAIKDRYPHQVSGGQLQRVMAAMALCGEPNLLVLDEPTTALDVTTQIQVLKTFKNVIKKEGTAAIYVSHDLAVVAQIADYIVVLYNGEVKEAGPTDIILDDPQHPYTKKLISAIRPVPEPDTYALNADKETDDLPLLKLHNIDAGYGPYRNGQPSIKVLQDIQISIGRCDAVGVIGESGCGKSTLARVMAGLLPASSGQIFLDGDELPPALKHRSRAQLKRIQFVYQMADTALNPKMRVQSILARPLEFYLALKGKKLRARVEELLELVELPKNFADRYPHELSGGQKQRVSLARALAAEPDIVLCDEVTSALDTIVAQNIIEMLARLQKQIGMSFVFISHDLSNVAAFADEIVVLYAGRVVEQGPTNKVLAPPFHPYTRLLIGSIPEPKTGWLDKKALTWEAIDSSSEDFKIATVGCSFYGRCPIAIEGTCDTQLPPQRSNGKEHIIECHRTLGELDQNAAFKEVTNE